MECWTRLLLVFDAGAAEDVPFVELSGGHGRLQCRVFHVRFDVHIPSESAFVEAMPTSSLRGESHPACQNAALCSGVGSEPARFRALAN